MKVALCFIINYEHILNKEVIWREWIEPNKDIINVYFYYKDIQKIKSKWILENIIPKNYIYDTSYYHIIPAYISILQFAMKNDNLNKWFCLLTDSCCPIISPKKFRYLFYKNYNYSLFSWKIAWWNPFFHKRGNLIKLPKELWLANDPWFILTLINVKQIIDFINNQKNITKIICDGGLANETLFAVIFKLSKELNDTYIPSHIKCISTHITDWKRRTSPTSPHVFKYADEEDIFFINKELERNNTAIFIRKIDTVFPDNILRYYIFEYNKEKDKNLILIQPIEMIYNKYYYIIITIIFFIYIQIFYKIDLNIIKLI